MNNNWIELKNITCIARKRIANYRFLMFNSTLPHQKKYFEFMMLHEIDSLLDYLNQYE